jgi:hypothetical protein
MSPPRCNHAGPHLKAAGFEKGVPRPTVYLSSLISNHNPTLQRLMAQMRKQPGRHYRLTNRLQDAEIIFFVENGYFGLESLTRLRAIKKEAPGAECFVFSESDWPFAYIPGLYCSLARRLPWAFSWSYLLDNESEPATGSDCDQRFLFSFIGRVATHPVRRTVLGLDGPNTPCIDIGGTSARFPDWDYARSYSQILSRSHFVLCPRGIGTSSVRLFEAMRAGRVPVIISDAWIVPPVGDWPRFSIRVTEDAVARIPQICEQHLNSAASMGDLARQTYDAYFSPPRFLDSALNVLRGAPRGSPSVCSAKLVRNAARAVSGREIRTVAHRLLNTFRARTSV